VATFHDACSPDRTDSYSMDLSVSTFPDMIPPPGPMSPKSLQGQSGVSETAFPPHHRCLLWIHHPYCLECEITISIRPWCPARIHLPIRQRPSVAIDEAPSHPYPQNLSLTLPGKLFSQLFRNRLFRSQCSKVFSAIGELTSIINFAARPRSVSSASLPSTSDLQRYVAAYIQYFHPHLPFLHIPSLTFDSPAYTTNLRAARGHSSFSQSGIAGGGGCLILAMAAIGALYEFDIGASKDLFESAKKMIQLYLEERRKAICQPLLMDPPAETRTRCRIHRYGWCRRCS
jgi:hypothetical protein